MTLVGDVAQTGSAAGATSWAQMLDPFVAGRWRLSELTVNYRTPAAVMRLASAVLQAAGIDVTAPTSVREGDSPPVAIRLDTLDDAALVEAIRAELARIDGGRLAVIAPARRTAALYRLLARELDAGVVGSGADAIDSPLAVLSVGRAKGLEFDGVVLVAPDEVMAESARGANDLYVALTRPTQRLLVLHSASLPAGLDTLRDSLVT
jgi:DNA helicase IV